MFLPQSLFCFALMARVIPAFSTLAKSNSTGVDRPKIVTETFKRL